MDKQDKMKGKPYKPIKLTILLQDLEFGGTQRYTINLLRHLDRQLFAPELWILRGGDDMFSMASKTNVGIVRFSTAFWVTPRALIHFMQRLALHRPQILYTLTVVPNIWGRVFGKMARVPAIVSGYRDLLPKQHERHLWPLSDRIICNSEALKNVMTRRLSVDQGRIAVVPNAVDVDLFIPEYASKASDPTVLYVGRLVKDKDPVNLLKAFKLVVRRLPKARLEIVGNGPLRQKLEAFIQTLLLESRVKLLSGTVNISPYLNKAWVFSLASVQEASPNVILEAMASGLPIVATRVGGIPELVEEGQTGLLVKPRDTQGLADALTSLLKDDQQRLAMGLKARERVLTRHSLQKTVRQTEQVLLEAVEDSITTK